MSTRGDTYYDLGLVKHTWHLFVSQVIGLSDLCLICLAILMAYFIM